MKIFFILKITVIYLLFTYCFANESAVQDSLSILNKNFQSADNNLEKVNYPKATVSISSIVTELEKLEKIFKPLLKNLKDIQKDAKNILEQLKKGDKKGNPSGTNLEKTKNALKQSQQEGQNNKKVTEYIKEAEKKQKEKMDALAQQNQQKAIDLEKENIEYIEKAIAELSKSQGKGGKGDKKNDKNEKSKKQNLSSAEAVKKLNQVQRQQEKNKDQRRKNYGQKLRIQKVPVTRDW